VSGLRYWLQPTCPRQLQLLTRNYSLFLSNIGLSPLAQLISQTTPKDSVSLRLYGNNSNAGFEYISDGKSVWPSSIPLPFSNPAVFHNYRYVRLGSLVPPLVLGVSTDILGIAAFTLASTTCLRTLPFTPTAAC
jgi:hypothetical protein